ncbi:glutamine-hydrolyzing GMP synthase [Blattabacterium cuenoti]|uniref:glutamine-hydrolyzing GMP synthase n=1 Tax=Blattabacterium cuenoti TaxID=1653831 RepID=UPI00163BA71C|nr:glutamine-hydrolyzing GMP synthase [Blattabacterium cuenoti]
MKKNLIIVLDFGSQYSYMIAKRIREIGVYSLLLPHNIFINDIIEKNPKGIILSGGPFSVYKNNAPLISKKILELNIPILGICYGMQLISYIFGGKIKKSNYKEYGKSYLVTDKKNFLFKNVPKKSVVWMSHYDEVKNNPKELESIAHTNSCKIAAYKHKEKDIYAVQFHPEVKNTEYGKCILKNFVINICKCNKNWKLEDFVQKQVNSIKNIVSDKKVILGISGGLDSFVTAYIINKAIGNSLICIFIDTGFLLKEEKKTIQFFCKKMNFSIKVIDAVDIFLKKLTGVYNPEIKRKIIGKEFVTLFQKESRKINNVEFLAQGTIYSDVIESSINKNVGLNNFVKSHHNVGGLPKCMKLKLIEPLRKLFKDEVRKIGKSLKLPKEILYKHPFPGPGLSIRIIGKINKRKISILRKAENILLQELKNFNIYNNISQAFIILLPIKSVGVMGDKRSYEHVAVLRVIKTEDFMTSTFYPLSYEFLEIISNRIINEINGINRMVYDITSKPPSTIEWQ